jgi:hypothetical protein
VVSFQFARRGLASFSAFPVLKIEAWGTGSFISKRKGM